MSTAVLRPGSGTACSLSTRSGRFFDAEAQKAQKRGKARGARGETLVTFEDGSDRIIGAAIEVHRSLGPGFLEKVYENALRVELRRRGISFVSQMAVPIRYLDVDVGTHVLDLLVEDRIVVELEAVQRVEDVHFAIVRSYLKAAGREHALVLNFAGTKLEIKRVFARSAQDACRLPGFVGIRVQDPASDA